ncbi:MAG: sugar phosphate nucleotidyltransferase, partial [Cyclobacteriaceae bacterium]|nr:sugar phosphate nucleotidyltransferase [Cyclobacteriaceae bacterium]
MKPTLVVLAAGMGSRYGGLKQLDPVGPSGETIIDYSVYDAIQGGFGKVVFVIRSHFEKEFSEKVSNKYKDKIEVVHVFQETGQTIEGLPEIPNREKPWGTGHAVLVTEPVINEPFAVINADDYYGKDGFATMGKFLSEHVTETHYGMIGYVLQNTLSENGSVSRGVCSTDENQFLVDVVERTKIQREGDKIYFQDEETKIELPAEAPVSMNFWGFHPNVFVKAKEYFKEFISQHSDNPKAEYYIPIFVNRMLEEKRMKMTVLSSNDRWFGVTYIEDRPDVVREF